MVRTFTAIDIEREDILNELTRVRNHLDLGFSPVEPDKMHITLEFFEDIGKEEIEKVKKAMEEVSVGSFSVEIRGVGCFPSRDYIRVVWAGVESENIYELEEQISDNGVISDNDHEFQPHITLLRVKNLGEKQKNRLRRTIREFEDHKFGNITVKNVKLIKSEFKSGETVYTEIQSSEI